MNSELMKSEWKLRFPNVVDVDMGTNVMGMPKLRITFNNGYAGDVVGAIIYPDGSYYRGGVYGDSLAPFELAVMVNDHCVYDTPITDDVLGYLTKEEVIKYLHQISELPHR